MENEFENIIEDGIDGVDGRDGRPGEPGYTPIKGVDYWTDQDRLSIVKEAASLIPLPQEVNIDEVISRTKEELRKDPINFKDIKGTEKLVEYLKAGGFRGGGFSGVVTDSTLTGNGLATTPLHVVAGAGSPLTTKGDIYVYSTANTRLPVGINGQFLLADSTATTGLKWNTITTSNISEGTNLYFTNARALTALTGQNISIFNNNAGYITSASLPVGANPTGTIGLSAVNGSASTFLRSDGAPALSQAIVPTWTGVHTFTPAVRTSGSASYFTINSPADTGITANTESRGVNITGSTRTWADGTVASQSEYYFGAPTYNKTTTAATFTQAQTAYFGAAPIAGAGVTITNGYSAWFNGNVHIGTQLGGSPFAPIGGTGLEVSDSNTTVAGQQIGLTNTSSSVHAFSGYAMFNDLANGSAYTHYAGAFYNSSTFNDTAFGTAFAVANQLSLYGTDGPTLIGTIATGSAAYLNVVIGGASTTNEVARFTTSSLGLTSIALNESVGGTLASASTVNIGAATGNYLTISGSVTITAFDTVQAGTRRVVTFTGTPILTNSSALVLPWGNITVVAGDSATFVSKGGGNWICTQYQRSTSTGSGAVVFAAAPTFTGTATFGAITTNSASTQSIGGVTLNIGGNTTTTTANILGGATINTAISTVNINQGATASGGTKITNIGTAGLAGSTTTTTIGSTLGTSTTTFNGTSIFTSTLRLKGYTVATLPAGTQGDVAFCTDLLAPAFFAVVVGGGAVVGTVFYNGTNWVAI